MVDLKKSNVSRNSSTNCRELVLLLPPALQPKMLSSALEEKFAESKNNSTFLEAGITFSLKRMLHSEEFYRGIVRLIRHSSHKNQQKVDEHFVNSLKTILKSIELRVMKKIETHLIYNGSVIPGSEKEVPYFLEKINHRGKEIWNVYISAGEDEAEGMSAIDLTLSQVINGECNGLLQDTVVCIPSMLHSQPGKIKSLLDRMKIRQDDSLDSEGADFVPELGSFIPIADHHLLSPVFKPLLPGDYVGYEVEDPSLQLEEGNATYIYAVIIHEVATREVNLFAKSYKIDIGHESVAPATDLYTFCRIQEILSTTGEHLDFQSANGKQAVLNDVSRAIREAYRLLEDKRRKVVKRLFLYSGTRTEILEMKRSVRRFFNISVGKFRRWMEKTPPTTVFLVAGNNVKGSTLHGGKSTGRRTLDTMENRHGRFPPASAKRILNLGRQNAGSDRLKMT